MIVHFEQLWEEAEGVVTKWYEQQTNPDVISDMDELIHRVFPHDDEMVPEERTEVMGQMLLAMCYLAKKYDINTYSVLKEAMNDLKVEMLDPDIEMDI